MLQFNNNHIFTGYLKQFLASFNLPNCRIYTSEFEKYFLTHGKEDPRVIESSLPIVVKDKDISSEDNRWVRPAIGITYLKDGNTQQYFWDTAGWDTTRDISENKGDITKYWKSNKTIHYNGNKVLGFTKTLKNPTTLYNYQTHEYLGDYLRFLRDYENINLMSMYNCFSDRLCNNLKLPSTWHLYEEADEKTAEININSYDTNYKIYMLPVKLFENYTIAIDCYQGVEMFCGFYNEKLDTSEKALDLFRRTYKREPKTLFSQPFIYDKLGKDKLGKYLWSWEAENTVTTDNKSIMSDTTKILRSEVALRESELKLFIKIPSTNTSSIVVLEGNYLNCNDSLYTLTAKGDWQYKANSTVMNFETTKTYKYSTLPKLNLREFKPISKLQLLALNTGISYPFADRLIEYLILNVIVPNDSTPDNIRRLQKVMEDCGYSFQIDGIWEPKMQMILYDYLMNSGKFTVEFEKATDAHGEFIKSGDGKFVYAEDENGNKIPTGRVENKRTGNLKQIGQTQRSNFYDVLGYGDKDAEKLYASWKIETIERNGKQKQQVVAKTTLENVDIYNNLYNN